MLASLTMAVCVLSKVTCNKRLVQTDPVAPSPLRTGRGGILGIAGRPPSPARSSKVVCYKHMTHLDSLHNPNKSKRPSLLLLSLLSIPQVLASCSSSRGAGEACSHVARCVSGQENPVYILGHISFTRASSSVATDGVS